VATLVTVWHDPLDGWDIASKFVGDDHPRLDAVPRVQHAIEEALCGMLVASTLDQDVQLLQQRGPG